MRNFYATDKKFLENEYTDIIYRLALVMGKLKELQTILSKELPPERYNGIMDLFYIIHNPKSTSEEIESSLVKCVIQTD